MAHFNNKKKVFLRVFKFCAIIILIASAILKSLNPGIELTKSIFEMALIDLGKGLTSALQKFVSSRTIDEKVKLKIKMILRIFVFNIK